MKVAGVQVVDMAEPEGKLHKDMENRCVGDIPCESYEGKTVQLGIMGTAMITGKNVRALKLTDSPKLGVWL